MRMHGKVEITDLTVNQFQALDEILKTRYEFPRDDSTRMCVTFILNAFFTRHAEMPAAELDQALHLLELVGTGSKIVDVGGRPVAATVTPALVETSDGNVTHYSAR